jgi:putative solute:sodium symporter small subunit
MFIWRINKGGFTVIDSTESRVVHWQRTRNLMFVHIGIWLVFSFVVHAFAPSLNKFSFMDFPLGYYMAAQGALVVFVVQLFVFVKQQEKIDRDCGVAEE